MKGSHKCI